MLEASFGFRPGLREVEGNARAAGGPVLDFHGLAVGVLAGAPPLGADSGVVRDGRHLLAFEGYLLDEELAGDALRADLLRRFRARGAGFVGELSGSFQLLIRDPETLHLWTDPLATRRLFVRGLPGRGHGEKGGLAFAPEIDPLLALGRVWPELGVGPMPPAHPDAANLAHLLSAGRCFAGGSPVEGVHQLLPGEHLAFREGRWHRHFYARYRIEPDPSLARQEALGELGSALEAAVGERWRRSAGRGAILLSGGYDSRALLHSLIAGGVPGSEVLTTIWGEDLRRPGSDALTAALCARRAGARHRSLPWLAEPLPEVFATSFRAQSGMTEYAISHADDLRISQLLANEEGVRCLFRGDEVFGPRSAAPATRAEALRSLLLDPLAKVEGAVDWWRGAPSTKRGEARQHFAAHEAARARALEDLPTDPHALRDTLYARERLPALQHHLSYHKAHFLEVVNPLLDRRIVELNQRLPNSMREAKNLFRELFARRFRDQLEVPIATSSNGIDWPGAVRRSRELQGFFRERLEALPAPLDPAFFLRQLDEVVAPFPAPAPRDVRRIPPIRLLLRGVLAGEWLHRLEPH